MTFSRIPPVVSNAVRLASTSTLQQVQRASSGVETSHGAQAPDGAPPPRSGNAAAGAMLVPRRPLSFLTNGGTNGGTTANDGPAAAMALELRQHVQDASAWRAAWKEVQYSSTEGWAGALAPLGQLEARVAEQLRPWGPEAGDRPPLPAAQRESLVAMQDLLWGLRDGQVLVAWAGARGPATPMQLADHYGLDAAAASASEVRPGAAPLTQQESMALSLYSVNAQVQMLREPALSRAFHVVNTALRHQQPEMQWAVQGLTQPLLSGMERLPAVPDEAVLRGLWLPGPDALAVVQDRMKPGAQFNTTDVWTGSREAPYPGQVVFVIQPLPDAALTQARDTSAFSYAAEQREAAFTPGARFEVKDVERFEPGRKEGAGIDLSGAQTASSGRSWQTLDEQPLLKVTLQEVPPRSAGK